MKTETDEEHYRELGKQTRIYCFCIDSINAGINPKELELIFYQKYKKKLKELSKESLENLKRELGHIKNAVYIRKYKPSIKHLFQNILLGVKIAVLKAKIHKKGGSI